MLHEVVHAGLDLLDVALGGVHPAFERADALDFVELVEEHLAEDARRPLAEERSANRVYAITKRNDNVQVEELKIADNLS